MINKLLCDIDATDESLLWFIDDPGGYLDDWEAKGANRRAGRWMGGTLDARERRAFLEMEYATLYGMGAHPFLLWQTVRAVLVPHRMPIAELIVQYRESVLPLGYPDFTT